MRAVLERRQPDLTVVLENVHDPHNVSAILRSCDAVGVLAAHAVYTTEEPPALALSRETSASAAKWVPVVHHSSIESCYQRLRSEGFTIVATGLGDEARPLFAWDLRGKIALVLGNEMRGVSDLARDGADGLMAIPMMGMVQSLNVSVAAAVCLYEALRQRLGDGCYSTPQLNPSELHQLEEDWLQR